tara:strand:- start:454 stop:834 length:381 start_codon:yes stop_codon:yes gene_type:complete
MKTIVVLSVLCAFFAMTTIFLIWYVRKILTKLLFVSENIGDFVVVVDNYASHLETVYNMDMFHGDETIQGLIEHTKEVVTEAEEFESVYSLTTDLEEYDEDDEEDELSLSEIEEILDDEENYAAAP